jgi:hypothetical protein
MTPPTHQDLRSGKDALSSELDPRVEIERRKQKITGYMTDIENAYAHMDYEKQRIAELESQLAAKPDYAGVLAWKPNSGENIFVVSLYDDVVETKYQFPIVEDDRNFKDKTTAQRFAANRASRDILDAAACKLIAEYERVNGPWVPNFNDAMQDKGFVLYNHRTNEFYVLVTCHSSGGGTPMPREVAEYLCQWANASLKVDAMGLVSERQNGAA